MHLDKYLQNQELSILKYDFCHWMIITCRLQVTFSYELGLTEIIKEMILERESQTNKSISYSIINLFTYKVMALKQDKYSRLKK